MKEHHKMAGHHVPAMEQHHVGKHPGHKMNYTERKHEGGKATPNHDGGEMNLHVRHAEHSEHMSGHHEHIHHHA